MKQIFKMFLFVFALSFFCLINEVYADYEVIVNGATPCKLYEDKTGKEATGSCIYSNTSFNSYVATVIWVDNGDKVTVLTEHEPVTPPKSGYGSECTSNFYYVSNVYNNKTYKGYVCGDIIQKVDVSEELKNEFIAAGFTEEYESYWDELAALKKNHPNWTFIAIDTQLNFNTVVKEEATGSKSLYQSTSSASQGYLSTEGLHYNWETDTFKVYDGSTWYAANSQTVAYYIDPRNFLSDMYIFQFETLAYVPELHTLEGVKTILEGAYIAQFADYFMEAAITHKINPLYLASLSLQEVGSNKSTAISGETFTYEGKTYSGVYNFYNIGATSGSNPVYRGLVYASKSGDGITYGRPWNNEQKAIIGGAEFITSGYMQYGQNTSYFKKWNVVANYQKSLGLKYYNNYTHQYMTNVRAPSSEAVSTYRSLAELNKLDEAYIFYIPVYKDMPEETTLPNTGNPNNRLKSISVNDKVIDGFEVSQFEYKVYVEHDVEQITLAAQKINNNAQVSGTGVKELVVGENNLEIKVKAQNGNYQSYNIVVVRAEAPTSEVPFPPVEDILKEAEITYNETYISNLTFTDKPADFANKIYAVNPNVKVEIKDGEQEKITGYLTTGNTVTITSGDEIKTYSIVLYGDVSGDGQYNVLDLLKIQKHILKSSLLNGAYLEAADVNKDDKINVQDLLRIQKTILGDAYISQK